MREQATTERPVNRPRGETWDTPIIPTTAPARPQQRHEAGEVETTLRGRWWWRMADLTENTRIAIKVTSISGIAIALLTVGMWLGGLTNERASNLARLGKIDERVTALESRFANIDKTLIEINERQKNQGEPLATIGRLSQYQVELLRDLETALAKRGIDTEKHGP